MTLDPQLPLIYKDFQHAHILVQSTNFDAAPKAKFLYHIVFELTNEAREAFGAEDANLKLLSVLANTVTLPSYSATIDTLNQYNRKKKYQTKIDYKDVTISFYDDNAGVSRSFLERYYKYYFKEATKKSNTDINYRDKYSSILSSYGLDNNREKPFFESIKIFQLSKQEWFAYTLVNPIISQWNHDNLSYSESASITENKITVGYEAVLYTNGRISSDGQPLEFGTDWYDQIPGRRPFTDSIITELNQPSVISQERNTALGNELSSLATPIQFDQPLFSQSSVLRDIFVPKTQSTAIDPVRVSSFAESRFDSEQITNRIAENQQLADTLVNQVLATGSYSSEWNSSNFSDYKNLSQPVQDAIQQDIISQINTNVRIQKIASTIVSK